MSKERRLGLSAFERVLHRKKKTTLVSEVRDCFEYFQRHSPKVLGDNPIILIHGNGFTLRRSIDSRRYRYTVQIDDTTDKNPNLNSQKEQEKLVEKIRHITIPYARHVRRKTRNR